MIAWPSVKPPLSFLHYCGPKPIGRCLQASSSFSCSRPQPWKFCRPDDNSSGAIFLVRKGGSKKSAVPEFCHTKKDTKDRDPVRTKHTCSVFSLRNWFLNWEGSAVSGDALSGAP